MGRKSSEFYKRFRKSRLQENNQQMYSAQPLDPVITNPPTKFYLKHLTREKY